MKQLIRKLVAIGGVIVLTAQNRGFARGTHTPQTAPLYRKQATTETNTTKSPKDKPKSPKNRGYLDRDDYPFDPSRKSRDPRQDVCPHDYQMKKNYPSGC